jgi:hypothetical protein
MIDNLYQLNCNTPSDINEHLPTLKHYCENVETVVELGVRGICSTWAFLAARPKRLYSYDLLPPSNWGGNLDLVYTVAKDLDVEFEFRMEDVLKVDIPECEVLFIDTWHTYDQLSAELSKHSHKVSKYIILHDTVSYAYVNEPISHTNSYDKTLSGKQGLKQAIVEFTQHNLQWKVLVEYINNNGLTILSRSENLL